MEELITEDAPVPENGHHDIMSISDLNTLSPLSPCASKEQRYRSLRFGGSGRSMGRSMDVLYSKGDSWMNGSMNECLSRGA